MVAIAIVGSREFDNLLLFDLTLDQLTNIFGPFQLVSGGAEGPDSWAEAFVTMQFDWPEPIIHKPNWYPNGVYWPGAAKARNTRIVKDSECVVAFWDGNSGGTRDSIVKALKYHKPVLVVYPDGRKELDLWPDGRRSQ